MRQLAIDPGFRTESVTTLRLQLPAGRYDGERAIGFSRQLEDRLGALPGVRSVAVATDLPLVDGYSALIVRSEDSVRRGVDDRIRAYHHEVSPGFFSTMGIGLERGRDFTTFDGNEAPLVAIVSQKFAARSWPNEDPVGRRMSISGVDGPWRTVVGVVDDIRYRSLVLDPIDNPDDPDIYFPLAQMPSRNLGIALHVASASVDLEPVRAVIGAIDPAIPVFAVQSMESVLDAELSLPRLASWLFGLFGVVALALAALGLYGLLAHLVSERSRDTGIRLALGARPSHVVAGIIKRGLSMAAVGLVFGLTAAVALGRVLESHLFDVSGTDPWTLAICSIVLLAVAVTASYLPARRASRNDPIQTLRQQ